MALVRPPLSAPGVYVQEVPSGVRTITGVSTSLTVFFGRTERGPVNTPTRISSWEEYENIFGGLVENVTLPYSVQDFFLNGGAQALIVRLFHGDASAAAALIALASGGKALTDQGPKGSDGTALKDSKGATVTVTQALVASSPGLWGSRLTYSTDTDGIFAKDAQGKDTTNVRQTLLNQYATRDWPAKDLFNLTVTYVHPNGQKDTERFSLVSLHPQAGSRRLDRVLAQSSAYALLADSATGHTAADSAALTQDDFEPADGPGGLNALDHLDVFNIVCIPPDTFDGDTLPHVYTTAASKCARYKATLIVDPPAAWTNAVHQQVDLNKVDPETFNASIGITPSTPEAAHSAVYYPRIIASDPLQGGVPVTRAASGIIAGIYARTDATRGVWKAPASYTEAGLSGILGLAATLTDDENGVLNSKGVNCLRSFSATGPVVWGARTIAGSDDLSSDFKYVPVRRLTDYIEQTLLRQTRWAVFEPNDEPLWAQIRLAIGSFMNDLFRQGAFQGSSRDQAFFVKCDASTTTQDDINRGIVNVEVGFAPLKPAEFVVLYIEQKAGQTA